MFGFFEKLFWKPTKKELEEIDAFKIKSPKNTMTEVECEYLWKNEKYIEWEKEKINEILLKSHYPVPVSSNKAKMKSALLTHLQNMFKKENKLEGIPETKWKPAQRESYSELLTKLEKDTKNAKVYITPEQRHLFLVIQQFIRSSLMMAQFLKADNVYSKEVIEQQFNKKKEDYVKNLFRNDTHAKEQSDDEGETTPPKKDVKRKAEPETTSRKKKKLDLDIETQLKQIEEDINYPSPQDDDLKERLDNLKVPIQRITKRGRGRGRGRGNK